MHYGAEAEAAAMSGREVESTHRPKEGEAVDDRVREEEGEEEGEETW